ncbi:protein lethal(3)malignant blood neoplasm 1 isoform X1 [Drosophila busckii]|uniref:protein lethal(3)malignant blood neoplasm 1 isoform X1 n=1 Tax=Drosophila busckii TaxID=30019 RepID=UPI001432D72F|nr:protein lethal(3)malignant blood neoplasm 1 isoform X1 [Drosophila busckii]
MKFTLLAAKGVLLTVLCCSSVLSAATTVRPYKFGFTVEEQQHRQESRDERGIVTGEFGFITADGKYHVTVYATDENGKFRIVSMKSFPYAGPISPNAVPAATALTTTSSKPPAEPTKHSFYSEGCAGCFLKQSTPAPPAQAVPATSSSTLGAFASPAVLVASSPSLAAGHAKSPSGNRGTKTEIRPLSLPLTPTAADAPAVVGTKPGQAPNSPDHTKSGHASNSPGDTKFGQAPNAVVGNAGNLNTPTLTTTIEQKQRQPPAGGLASTTSKGSALFGQAATAEEIGDLYKFKYLLDYNGHEETGSRNGNKQGKYFSISDDAVQHTVEYIANEFGFQPHVSWRKLTAEEANLPAENGLKHYEFKWFKLPE